MNGSRGKMKVVYNKYDWNIILMSVINLLLFNCDSDDVMKIVKILLMMTMMAMVTTLMAMMMKPMVKTEKNESC